MMREFSLLQILLTYVQSYTICQHRNLTISLYRSAPGTYKHENIS